MLKILTYEYITSLTKFCHFNNLIKTLYLCKFFILLGCYEYVQRSTFNQIGHFNLKMLRYLMPPVHQYICIPGCVKSTKCLNANIKMTISAIQRRELTMTHICSIKDRTSMRYVIDQNIKPACSMLLWCLLLVF